ncbi:MAG: crossover junction endodeoxyribonuclease RuvC [Dehalogenimonas sp.]|jgi:crossover junction endodeoxyribonuclease RuvC|uniref:Crossover junction endodeoxyribonuclease RuvC n=1 Tax=Candidatus Dehalogenimonas loeffleri TaxID=3127115 RepID=A0ABZ2J1K9_9CHLR|nr:crossover junction endodeoxyribonuclease RuvC [Dehalogenimonas sp.]
MRVLGVDPGTLRLGFGVVDAEGASVVYVSSGTVKCSDKLPVPERLKLLYAELEKVIRLHKPDCAAVESPFFSVNARSALAIGKAQTVAILAAVNAGLEVFEYPPALIKSHIAGFGASTKDQVTSMVMLQLRLTEPLSSPDAADALACALCHIQEARRTAVIRASQA